MEKLKVADEHFDDIVSLLKKRNRTSIRPFDDYDRRAATYIHADKTKPTVF